MEMARKGYASSLCQISIKKQNKTILKSVHVYITLNFISL